MAVVSISRQYGAGGRMMGEKIAEKLGYRLVDRAILTEVAHKAGVSVRSVQDVEQEAGGLLSRLVNELVKASPYVRNLPDYSATFDEEAYRAFLKRSSARWPARATWSSSAAAPSSSCATPLAWCGCCWWPARKTASSA